jgi:ABC-type Zn uptake system ZnuABC Zn-binding protein ZnuA
MQSARAEVDFSQLTIKTSSPILAHRVHQILVKKIVKFEVESLVQTDQDLHDFELTPDMIKALMKADLIILGPIEALEWGKQLIKLYPKKVLTLTLPKNLNPHFWLSAEAACLIDQQIQQHFTTYFNRDLKTPCPFETDFSLAEKAFYTQKNFPFTAVVSSHDTVLSYFRNAGLKTLALRSGHHHDEMKTKAAKELQNLLQDQKSKVLFIIEGQFKPLDQHLLKHRRPQDYVIHWNPVFIPAGKDWTSPLKSLINAVNELK